MICAGLLAVSVYLVGRHVITYRQIKTQLLGMQLFAVEEDMSGLVGLVFVQKVGPVALFGSCQGITWDLSGPQN